VLAVLPRVGKKVLSGASIHAWRILRRHIVALEEDKAIFDAILAPMICVVPSTPSSTATVILHSDDEDALEVEVAPVVKKSRFSK